MEIELPDLPLRAKPADDPEAVAERARAALGVSVAEQTGWRSDSAALEKWRNALESLGVLVFQAAALKRDEARGFSISESPLPVIVLAAGETNRPRIFTAMHELAHLILRAGGICDLDDDEEIEAYCNRVAGSILVPRNALESIPDVQQARRDSEWSDDQLDGLAKLFSVSQEVVLRRLLIIRKTSAAFYKRKREEFLARYARMEGSSFGIVSYPERIVRRLGQFYVGLVLDAYRTETITSSALSDFLGVNLKHLPNIEQVMIGAGKG
jgi:Zn-dependent peptidase ImmA (M78 family)